MARRPGSNSGGFKRVVLWLLIVAILIGVSIIVIDVVGNMFGVFFPIPGMRQLKEMAIKKKIDAADDVFLLEKEELAKVEERLDLLNEQIMVKAEELKKKEREAEKKLEILKEKEVELDKKSQILEDKENKYNDRQKNIREQAVKLYNMPPQDAVSLLEKQTESDIIDILREIDNYSEETGRASTSPYLMKLMGDLNKDKTANVLRKLKYSAGETTSSVDILDELAEEEPEEP